MARAPKGTGGARTTRGARAGGRRKTTAQVATEELLRQREHDLGERVKELNCFYGISTLIETPGISLQEILQGTADLIPSSWQYPEITCARIILEGKTFRTAKFKETTWGQTCDFRVNGQRVGRVEVYYLEERPESDEGPFLKEERALITVIAERLGHITESRRAEEELRQLKDELEERVAQQSRSLMELSTPVLRLWEEIVLLPLVGVVDTPRAQQMLERLLEAIVATESRVAIMDITGVPVIDTKVAQHLMRTVNAARMLGTEVILTGVSPEVAQTLTKIDINLAVIATRGTLRAGVAEAFRLTSMQVVSLMRVKAG